MTYKPYNAGEAADAVIASEAFNGYAKGALAGAALGGALGAATGAAVGAHYLGNLFLTLLTNVLYSTTLTDMETCFKAVRADILKSFDLKSKRFGIEPEITAKLFKRWARVYEVPITYEGRDYSEGKKITWRDGFPALWTLIKYRFVD